MAPNRETVIDSKENSLDRLNGFCKEEIDENGNIIKHDVTNEEHNSSSGNHNTSLPKFLQFKTPIVWVNVFLIVVFHTCVTFEFLRRATLLPFSHFLYHFIYIYVVLHIYGIGVTAGAHRLWTHKSYKAKLPLRYLLGILYTGAGHNNLYDWIRDHRVHHKYSETDADPHNSKRGFFFAHVGWLMLRKHPEVLRKGKNIDMSDILEDPAASFVIRHFEVLRVLVCHILPIFGPVILWNETWTMSAISNELRYMIILNGAWLVNSYAHMFGTRPYDKRIGPTETNFVNAFAIGEGWHNYHHVFPWDYKASEYGRVNWTTDFLNLCGRFRWAYDFKEPSAELVKKVIENTGDGTHEEIIFNDVTGKKFNLKTT